MRYLLDTHVVLWWFSDLKKISDKTRNIISNKSNDVYISSASFWEMAIKQSIGRLTLPHNFLQAVALEGFKLLPIMPEEALGVSDLPLIHADLFDRLLVMQAKLHDLIIISNDAKMADYPVIMISA